MSGGKTLATRARDATAWLLRRLDERTRQATAPSYPLRGAREYSTMTPETRERLAQIFEPHNHRLEELLGRDLAWTKPGES